MRNIDHKGYTWGKLLARVDRDTSQTRQTQNYITHYITKIIPSEFCYVTRLHYIKKINCLKVFFFMLCNHFEMNGNAPRIGSCMSWFCAEG